MKWPNKQQLGLAILLLAGASLIGMLSWRWYQMRQSYFVSGTPPSALMDKIEPKQVPYDRIKPPAFLPTDALIYGSASSSVGINFYGDYGDQQSDALALQLQAWAEKSQGRVRFVWHYLPATSDDNDPSFEAAILSECSRLIDDRWKAHLLLLQFSKLAMRDVEMLTDQLADKDGMLYACRKDQSIRSYVKNLVDTARGDGIDKAPFVFVGTQVFPSQSASSTSVIQAAQKYLK